MSEAVPATSFARLGRRSARVVLAVTLVGCVASVVLSFSPLRSGRADAARRHAGDVALYRAVVERQQRGQSYYAAMGAELTERGYPTRSVFNWRTPLPLTAVGSLPAARLAKALLGLAALAALLLGFAMLAREFGTGTAVAGGALLSGAAMPCVLGDLFVMSEIWAGVLIGLSLAAYGVERRGLGTATGLAALFFRELALPYTLLCLLLALRERRWRETAVWIGGLIAYVAFLGQHMATVAAMIESGARSHDHGWICLGGWPFLISLAQMNAYLLVAPQWLAAIYLPLAVLGLAAWFTACGTRVALTGIGYLTALAIVGQPFNQYWGSLIAPVLCFGAAVAPKALADLWRAAQLSARRVPRFARG